MTFNKRGNEEKILFLLLVLVLFYSVIIFAFSGTSLDAFENNNKFDVISSSDGLNRVSGGFMVIGTGTGEGINTRLGLLEEKEVAAIPDRTLPSWSTTPTDKTIVEGAAFSYDIDATDNVAVDSYFISDTTNFAIDKATGLITNKVAMQIGQYTLVISVNDTSNNIISKQIIVTVIQRQEVDITAPQFLVLPTNQVSELGTPLSYSIECSDTSGISKYIVNDTIYFEVNNNGILTNKTTLKKGVYSLNVSVNDTLNNINNAIFSVSVRDTTKPVFDPEPENEVIAIDEVFTYVIHAKDFSSVNYSLTSGNELFVIDNDTGIINSKDKLGLGLYEYTVLVVDEDGNELSKTLTVNVVDMPTWVIPPINLTIEYPTGVLESISAFDSEGIDSYYSDDNVNFKIENIIDDLEQKIGRLTNITNLNPNEYALRIYVNDTKNTINYKDIKIIVKESSPPLVNLISPFNDAFVLSDVNFACNYTDNVGAGNPILLGDFNGEFTNIIKQNIYPVFTQNEIWFTVTNITEGTYKWNCQINDSVGNNGVALINYTIHITKNLDNVLINNSVIDNNSTAINTNATESNIIGSSAVNLSIILDSIIDESNVSLSNITNSTVITSIIRNSEVNSSNIMLSKVINSTIINSDALNSSIENAVILNSSQKNSIVNDSFFSNSNITDSRVYNNSIVLNSTLYLNTTVNNGIVYNSKVAGSAITNASINNVTLTNVTVINSTLENMILFNEVVIDNNFAPKLVSIQVNPSSIKDNDDVTCTINSTDIDSEALNYTITWKTQNAIKKTETKIVNKSTAVALSLSNLNTAAGDKLTCVVLVSDGITSQTFSSDTFAIPEETPVSKPSSGGGGGGSSGFTIPSDVRRIELSTTNEKAVTANKNTVVNFYFNSGLHSIKINAITKNNVTLTVSSTPITATLNEGESRGFDLNEDYLDDVKVKLNNIVSKDSLAPSVNISVKLIDNTMPKPLTETPKQDSTELQQKTEVKPTFNDEIPDREEDVLDYEEDALEENKEDTDTNKTSIGKTILTILFILILVSSLSYGGYVLYVSKRKPDKETDKSVLPSDNLIKIETYLLGNVKAGYNLEVLKNNLFSVGWSRELVANAIKAILRPLYKIQLDNYIKVNLKLGFDIVQLRSALLKSGWSEEFIDEEIDAVSRFNPELWLENYLVQTIEYDEEGIINALVEKGWDERVVREKFAEVKRKFK